MPPDADPNEVALERLGEIYADTVTVYAVYRDVLEVAVSHLDVAGVAAVLANIVQQIEIADQEIGSETDPVGSTEVAPNLVLLRAKEHLQRVAETLRHRREVLNRHVRENSEVLVACPECYETYEIFKVVGNVECPGCGEHHYPAFIGHKKPPPHPRSGA